MCEKIRKLSPEEKLLAVREYLLGKGSTYSIVDKYGITDTSIRRWVSSYKIWIAKYNSEGDIALLPSHTKKHYSKSFKQEVIHAYFAQEGSYSELCVRYNILFFDTVRKWALQYNDCSTIRDSETGGTKIMTKGRKITYEERIEIVSFCIGNHKNYQLTVDTYQVSYQQIYFCVKKYESKGVEALNDKRGKTKLEDEMTELEKLRAENRLLKAQNKR